MPQYQVYFDTREGERKYNVDFGEDERIEDVLRDIIGELSEKGHMMRGLATGDLKVIWGDGRELDLARTLTEQGVRPNDVLRVLVETYIGGGRSLRTDRIDKEWELLGRLARLNPGHLDILGRSTSGDDVVFSIRLRGSPGVARARGSDVEMRDTHTVRLEFGRLFPEVPIDCYVDEELFHPNVKPATGFVCLWDQASSRDTAVQALARAQAMAAYRMVNLGAPHLMNKEAVEWYQQHGLPRSLVPLSWDELRVYDIREGRMVWLEPGRHLAKTSRTHWN